MERENQTYVLEFFHLGLSENTKVQPLLFGMFLSMYLATLMGNLLIILAIISDSHLHTTMHLFLHNLSFSDICFTSTTVSKMLLNIQTESKFITFENCLRQINFSMLFGPLDNFLTVITCDCFLAICHPLHYMVMVIMNPWICGLLLLASWLVSVLDSLLQCLMVLQLSFCTELEIPYFFCELNQVLQLACSDTFCKDLVLYFAAGLLAVIPFIGILFSYSKIVSSILRVSRAEGKCKAFSTCVSHLSVTLFYGTGLGVYFMSVATQNSRASVIASVMYMVVIPMLNPLIYSLRNKEIKQVFEKLRKSLSIKGFFVSSLEMCS